MRSLLCHAFPYFSQIQLIPPRGIEAAPTIEAVSKRYLDQGWRAAVAISMDQFEEKHIPKDELRR